jgi:hypothetical protein
VNWFETKTVIACWQHCQTLRLKSIGICFYREKTHKERKQKQRNNTEKINNECNEDEKQRKDND